MTYRILEKIEKATRGEIDVGDIPGSTTERMTIGLALNALDKTNPSYAGDEKGAWEKLDASQRQIVRNHNREYRKKKWLTDEDRILAEPADEAWLVEAMANRKSRQKAKAKIAVRFCEIPTDAFPMNYETYSRLHSELASISARFSDLGTTDGAATAKMMERVNSSLGETWEFIRVIEHREKGS